MTIYFLYKEFERKKIAYSYFLRFKFDISHFAITNLKFIIKVANSEWLFFFQET